MKYVFLLWFVLGFEVQAANANKYVLKTTIKNDLKTIEVDLNQDGKVDRIETFRGATLVSIARDTKFSGKFDEWIEYFPYESAKKPIEIRKKDTNGDGKVDRIETYYSDKEHDLLIVKNEVDSLFKGVFDKTFTTHSKLNQEIDNQGNTCPGSNAGLDTLKILKLTKDVGAVKMSLNGGFYQTNWGYKIHQSCLEKWGADTFVGLLKSTMSKGFQCLADLAKKNNLQNAPNSAASNLRGLNYLLSSNSVSIVCNEKDYHWETAYAHASTNPTERIGKTGVKHPFISIEDTGPEVKMKPNEDETKRLEEIFFHEQFHNLGFKHGTEIEFAYTCGRCCVRDADSSGPLKDTACKVCAGGYEGANDKRYLNDFVAWARMSEEGDRAITALVNYQKEFPKMRWSLFAYADAATDSVSPIGIQMAKILKNKFANLQNDELAHLKNISMYEKEPKLITPKVSQYSKMVAEALVIQQYEGDTKKALTLFENNKELMKEILKEEAKAKGDEKLILGNIKKIIKDTLSGIWLLNYPNQGGAESEKAYSILNETSYLKK